MVFKPNGLLYVCSFQSDEVKAKRLFCLIGYRIDRLDGAFKPSEGAITGHVDETAYWQDSGLHGMLHSFLMNQMPSARCIRLFIPDRRSTSHDTRSLIPHPLKVA
jgi:hypothetical protein